MRARKLEQLDDAELVQAFVDTANRLGEAVINWLPAVKLARQLMGIEAVLRARGKGARLRLAPLLDDQNRYVQYYAAQHLEAFFPERCRRIIEDNAKQGDAIAGDAGMHLDAIDTGIYKPD
jgi:hypothetical protein